METLEHFFTCLPDSLSIIDHASPPVPTRKKLTDLLDQFIRRLAKKASASPKALPAYPGVMLPVSSQELFSNYTAKFIINYGDLDAR
ncbi:hypothetical protein RhiirA4_480010 [Rhizophagus irregularis]|uniref:Uncharacterized protein n=1 Tax=Rhizophagus irregularis TaxID=588596 RepID=A0A2I1HH99_9GLOM|nr:hypothetical protein RhiirA4_480010 [Rhizophagus irregularis]